MPEKKKIPKDDSGFNYDAALYFLSDQGHYLFKWKNQAGCYSSKFIRHNDVAAAFHGQEVDSGWIDPNVKRFGSNQSGNWYVYFSTAHVMQLTFQTDTINTVFVPIPSTILLVSGNDYRIFAIKGKDFKPTANLCQAPFPNVGEKGHICWGNTNLPKKQHQTAHQVWSLFFSSTFTEHTAERKLKGIDNSCIPFWLDLAERKVTAFPIKMLIESKSTISSVLGDT